MSAGQAVVAALTVAIWVFTSWCWWRVIKLSRDTARISADTARISAETAQIWRDFTAAIEKREVRR